MKRRPLRRFVLGIIALAAAGSLLTGGDTAAAISGYAAADSTAIRAQYEQPPPSTPVVPGTDIPSPSVGGVGTVDTTGAPPAPTLGSHGGQDRRSASPAAAQAPNQAVATSGTTSLPFTGLAAIPIMVIGALLVVAGAMIRRRVRHPA